MQRGAARGVRVRRRSRPAPPTAPASSPARSGSTPASWSRSCARASTTPRAERRALRRGRALGGGRARARRAARRRSRRSAGRAGGRARRAARRAGADWPEHAAAAPASCRRPTREGAAAVYLPACINRIFGRSRRTAPALACPRRWSTVSARAGLPVWIPDDVAGSCCGAALELEGLSRRPTRCMANETVERALALERGGRAAGRDRRDLLHPRRRRARRGRARRGERRAPRRARDPRLGRLGARAPAAAARGRARRSARRPSTRPARPATSASTRAPARARRRRSPTRSYVAAPATCCGFAGDRGILHPELTAAATARRGRRARRRATSTPTSAATAPARSASSGDRRALRVVRLPARGADPADSSRL